jgi:hypothetical protein
MSDPQAKGTGPHDFPGREPLLNGIIVHIPGDSFKRILFQVVQHLDFHPVPQMNHHIGVIAELGAQGFEFVRNSAEVSVGHYDYFYRAWHAILYGVRGLVLKMRRLDPAWTENATIAISAEKTTIFNSEGLTGVLIWITLWIIINIRGCNK